jgi:nitrous oxidase accessory protein
MKRALLVIPLLWGWLYCASQSITVCADCDVHSIKKALSLVSPGDTIVVKEGIYQEGNIKIERPVTLLGEDYPLIDAQIDNEAFTITADSVTISGFRIENVGTSYINDRAAIKIDRCNGCQILGNKLYDTFFGIHVNHSKNGLIRGNHVEGKAEKEMSSGNAIHLWYCKNMIIENNIALSHRDGIYLEFVDSSLIINNHSENHLRYGLHFMYSDDDEYINNTFRSNGAGVAVMFSDRINMIGNVFEDNWGTAAYGLLLKEIRDSKILNNSFKNNTIGIYGESAIRINFLNNDFIGNGWALRILGSCTDNVIRENNFISNTFDVTTNSSRNQNNYDENYWSGYAGYDLDHDGFGDIPYRPVSLFSFIISRSPTSIVLLRSLFIDVLNYAEKVAPVLTPETLADDKPAIKRFKR